MTTVMSVSAPATQVVDAASGRLLYRNPLSSDAVGERSGTGLPQLPRRQARRQQTSASTSPATAGSPAAPPGSRATTPTPTPTSTTTTRPARQRGGARRLERRLDYRSSRSTVKGDVVLHSPCPCSWDPDKPFSWKTNRAQNATQVFYFVNNVARPPAGGADRLHRGGRQLPEATHQARARAATRSTPRPTTAPTPTNGLPDGNHIDNANMSTPPDGHAADDADVPAAPARHVVPRRRPVLADQRRRRGGHRLPRVHPRPVQPAGRRRPGQLAPSATSRPARWARPGATGTPWTTWSTRASRSDTPRQGRRRALQVRRRRASTSTAPSRSTARSAPRRGRAPAARPATGGYTYADYGKVVGGPEVHADGEIWAQTLWDLRDELGSRDAPRRW